MSEISDNIIAHIRKITDDDSLSADGHNEDSLTGSYFKMDGVDMTYLLVELSTEYRLKLTYKDVENYAFNTINGIERIIRNHLNEHTFGNS